MLETVDLVYIAGLCAIASLANPPLALLPVLLAMLSPSNPLAAAFVGMLTCVLTSWMYHFIGRRGVR